MVLEAVTLATVKARLGLGADTDDDALLQTFVNQTNMTIWRRIGCEIGPSQDTVRYFDGYSRSRDGYGIFIRDGVRTLTEIATASQTGGDWSVVDPDDVIYRPFSQDREPGWPAQYLFFNDVSAYVYPEGHGNIRLTGSAGAAFGFAAIPDDLKDVAETTCVRAWLAKRSGQVDLTGVDENNQPIISRFISQHHYAILKFYRDGTRRWYRRASRP